MVSLCDRDKNNGQYRYAQALIGVSPSDFTKPSLKRMGGPHVAEGENRWILKWRSLPGRFTKAVNRRIRSKDFLVRQASAIVLTPVAIPEHARPYIDATARSCPSSTADICFDRAAGGRGHLHASRHRDNYTKAQGRRPAMVKLLSGKRPSCHSRHPEVDRFLDAATEDSAGGGQRSCRAFSRVVELLSQTGAARQRLIFRPAA